VLIALPSSGLHSNGYSLARAVLLDPKHGLSFDAKLDGLDATLGEVLLRPTKIYVKAAKAALSAGGVHAMCHVTGGGLPGNLPRVLPDGLGAEVSESAWTRPAIFDRIQRLGGVETAEMRRTFNLGVGLVIAVDPSKEAATTSALRAAGEAPVTIGRVVAMPDAIDEARVRYL
jgi:phosphoribosylformylglycinamidine cyclo-ligase